MAANGMSNGATGRNGLAKIHTEKKADQVCHDDSTTPMKAQTIDELHSLQMKKSAPTTPLNGIHGPFAEEERTKQQLQSISASLASLTRETGPKVVRGDPASKSRVVSHHHHFVVGRSEAVVLIGGGEVGGGRW